MHHLDNKLLEKLMILLVAASTKKNAASVDAFTSSSHWNYHHGNDTSSLRIIDDKSISIKQMSKCKFPTIKSNLKAGGYVPDGLTEEEYNSIKQKEQADLRKKNFGAWGPRFAPSEAPPRDNWMINPRLWTSGFVPLRDDSEKGENTNNCDKVSLLSLFGKVKTIVNDYTQAFVLVFLVTQFVLWSSNILKAYKSMSITTLQVRKTLTILKLLSLSTLSYYSNLLLKHRSLFWIVSQLFLSLILTPVVQPTLQQIQRKRLLLRTNNALLLGIGLVGIALLLVQFAVSYVLLLL